MNILNIGVDTIELERIQLAYMRHKDRFLKKIFSEDEIIYCLSHKDPIPRLAGKFAAKEAISKALGTGIGPIRWTDIIITSTDRGPVATLPEELTDSLGLEKIFLSITHNTLVATAFAVITIRT